MSGLFGNRSVDDGKKMGCSFVRPEGPGLTCVAAIGLRQSCDDSAGMEGQRDGLWPRPFQLDREGADQLIERGLGGPVVILSLNLRNFDPGTREFRSNDSNHLGFPLR